MTGEFLSSLVVSQTSMFFGVMLLFDSLDFAPCSFVCLSVLRHVRIFVRMKYNKLENY